MSLSIVIPTYNSIKIFQRCPFLLDDIFCGNHKIEIIITDDSTNNLVRNYLKKYQHINYIKHLNTGNPIDNWNYGINLCNNEFYWLLHHDEYVDNILPILDDVNNAINMVRDIIFLKVFVKYRNKIRIYKYLWLRSFFLKIPSLLYFMNVVGSPSCYIVRNKKFPIYDNNFCWIVDMVYLNKILKFSRNYYLSNSKVISDLDDGSIITKSIVNTKVLHLEEILKLQLNIIKRMSLLFLIKLLRK